MEKKIEQHIKGIENFKKDDLKHAETQIRERLPSKEGMYWKNQGVFGRAGSWECLTNIVTGIGNFDEHLQTPTLLNTPLMGGETARINHLMEKY